MEEIQPCFSDEHLCFSFSGDYTTLEVEGKECADNIQRIAKKILSNILSFKIIQLTFTKRGKKMIFSYRHVLLNSGTSSINLIGQILRLGENVEKSSFCAISQQGCTRIRK